MSCDVISVTRYHHDLGCPQWWVELIRLHGRTSTRNLVKPANPEETGRFKYSDFQPVVSRKKRKNKPQLERPSLLTLVQRAREELSQDAWNSRCQQILQDHLTAHSLSPSKILCLGLGSPSSSSNSRAQLGFLLEICKSTGIEHSNVSIYDPVFSQEDDVLFKQLGLCKLSENKANHSLEATTILWMPHCDLDLYESVLAANWSREQLPYVLLISNRLEDYVDSIPRQKLETRASCLLQLASSENIFECCPLPVCSVRTTAFNTIAIQSLNSKATIPDSWFPQTLHSIQAVSPTSTSEHRIQDKT
ncbi:SRR1-domain-containing protein [Mycena alexandri]|uniref:SRR1-domain-containing protein n=1 Tax=Mycena alexandri TaxID=1745969 RepID=A0AAD6XA38_9AGAR|nr:SRR1-domain-containing protein [Mycena alexandri]